MRGILSSLLAALTLAPSLAAAEPPAFPTVVVNRAEDLFDQTVACSGSGTRFQCDAMWDQSVIIDRVSAHCSLAGGWLNAITLITSISRSGPGQIPAEKLSTTPGPGATEASAAEGGRRLLPVNAGYVYYPSPTTWVWTLLPISMSTLVPQDRLARIVVEGGEMQSAICRVAFSGRWLK
jgi:hypothetical protein